MDATISQNTTPTKTIAVLSSHHTTYSYRIYCTPQALSTVNPIVMSRVVAAQKKTAFVLVGVVVNAAHLEFNHVVSLHSVLSLIHNLAKGRCLLDLLLAVVPLLPSLIHQPMRAQL
jgi:hypothetical protein